MTTSIYDAGKAFVDFCKYRDMDAQATFGALATAIGIVVCQSTMEWNANAAQAVDEIVKLVMATEAKDDQW